MGQFGRARVENELEWRYEAPKLLAAYEALGARAGTPVVSLLRPLFRRPSR